MVHFAANSAGVSPPWAEWDAPVFDQHAGFEEVVKVADVEELVSEATVEAALRVEVGTG